MEVLEDRTLLNASPKIIANEVFDVQIIPGVVLLSLTGSFLQLDGGNDVWVVGNP